MIDGFIQLLGGIGLFLLGMILMTDSLKELAGASLRQWLAKFTGSPIKAINSGIIFTLILQSSTATTLATIGFVSAGVLTFAQSIGVVIGANIGTTSTAWMVALLGVKLSIGKFALPLIAFGALCKILGSARWALTGLVMAGFGLIFYGIELLQLAMSGLATRIDLSVFSTASFFSKILLIMIGLIMTVILQSSTAAITTTIAALASQMIQLEQALLLVIGQNIGTVATAVLAAMTANANAKRTAAVHVLFNLISAVFAFIFLAPFLLWLYKSVAWIASWQDIIIVAAFHTAFSLCGACLFMPFLGHIKSFLYRIIPDDQNLLLHRLDDASLKFPTIALANTKEVIQTTIEQQLEWVNQALQQGHFINAQQLNQLDILINRLEEYLAQINVTEDSQDQQKLFYLLRMMVYLKVFRSDVEQINFVSQIRHQPVLYQIALDYLEITNQFSSLLEANSQQANQYLLSELLNLKAWIKNHRENVRQTLHNHAITNHFDAAQTLELLAAQRWLERFIAHHQRFTNVILDGEFSDLKKVADVHA